VIYPTAPRADRAKSTALVRRPDLSEGSAAIRRAQTQQARDSKCRVGAVVLQGAGQSNRNIAFRMTDQT